MTKTKGHVTQERQWTDLKQPNDTMPSNNWQK